MTRFMTFFTLSRAIPIMATFIAFASFICIILALIYSAQTHDERILMVAALASLCIAWLVLLSTDSGRLVSPLTLILALFLWGAIWKAAYLINDRPILSRALNGHSPRILIDGFILTAAGVLSFILGYVAVFRSPEPSPDRVEATWRSGWALLLCLAAVTVSGIGALMTVAEIGLATLIDTPSVYRFDHTTAGVRFGTDLYVYYRIALLARIAL